MSCTVLLTIILTIQPFSGGDPTNNLSGEELIIAHTTFSNETNGGSLVANEVREPQAQTTLYLVHPGGGTVSEAAIISLFRSGWGFQYSVEILGYTATDDLWTVVGDRSSRSPVSYDKVKIVLTKLKENTREWANCMRDIYSLSRQIPEVIVLESDPG